MNGKSTIEFFEIGRDGKDGSVLEDFFSHYVSSSIKQIGNIESKSWAPNNAAEIPFRNLTRLNIFPNNQAIGPLESTKGEEL